MVSIFGGQDGHALLTGLSTDEKPTPNQDGWLFLEVDSKKTFRSVDGEWVENV